MDLSPVRRIQTTSSPRRKQSLWPTTAFASAQARDPTSHPVDVTTSEPRVLDSEVMSGLSSLDLPGGKVQARPELQHFVANILADTAEWWQCNSHFVDRFTDRTASRRPWAVQPQSCAASGAQTRHKQSYLVSPPTPAWGTPNPNRRRENKWRAPVHGVQIASRLDLLRPVSEAALGVV